MADEVIGAICAAGWKGYIQKALNKPEWGKKLPEALIPLGDGETMLSRQVRQLKERNITDIFVGVGVEDMTSPIYADWLSGGGYDREERYDVDDNATVWTKQRLEYVDSLGVTSVTMPEFDYTPASFTVARLLGDILDSGKDFDTVLVSMGDYVMTGVGLDIILGLPVPCLWCPTDHHQGWLVNREAAEFLSKWLHVSGPRTDRQPWFNYLWDHLGLLEVHGIQIIEDLFPQEPHLIEVETPDSYQAARQMIGIE